MILCAVFGAAIAGCGGGEKPYTNPYPIEDAEMPDSMFDFTSLSAYSPEVTETEKHSSVPEGVKAVFYTSVPFGNLAHTKIFAYVGIPTSKKPRNGFPAVVLVHGGLGKAEPGWVKQWVDRGYVAIAPDIFSNMDAGDGLRIPNERGGPAENNVGSIGSMTMPDEFTWTYQRVSNIVHAFNVLHAMPETDGARIGLVGISWGAYLTCIASGIDKRFAFFAPIYGCGFNYDDSTFWGWGLSASAIGQVNFDKWKARYDPSVYLAYDVKPTLFVGGVNREEPFSCMSRQKSAEIVKGKVFLSYRVALSHSQESGAGVEEVFDFARHVLYGENTMLQIKACGVTGAGGAFFETGGNLSVNNLLLVYTDNAVDSDPHAWTWNTREVICGTDGRAETPIPNGTTAFFFAATDQNGAKSSSGIYKI
ncbi:hypothetical protein FACS1894211_03640 [Clostridia bacterium]|nr:hypothetical protein FACS1894211_03640 [Clostridia bacterium]